MGTTAEPNFTLRKEALRLSQFGFGQALTQRGIARHYTDVLLKEKRAGRLTSMGEEMDRLVAEAGFSFQIA